MKVYGSPIGGRAFFITEEAPIETLLQYFTSAPTWVTVKGIHHV